MQMSFWYFLDAAFYELTNWGNDNNNKNHNNNNNNKTVNKNNNNSEAKLKQKKQQQLKRQRQRQRQTLPPATHNLTMCRQKEEGAMGRGVGEGLGGYIEWASPLSGYVFVFTFHLKLPMPHISHIVTTLQSSSVHLAGLTWSYRWVRNIGRQIYPLYTYINIYVKKYIKYLILI